MFHIRAVQIIDSHIQVTQCPMAQKGNKIFFWLYVIISASYAIFYLSSYRNPTLEHLKFLLFPFSSITFLKVHAHCLPSGK